MIESVNWRMQLREAIMLRFSESEIQDLCYDLGVEYESLSGDNKNDTVRELIEHFERLVELPKLIKYCSEKRPNVPWDEIAAAVREEKVSKRFKLSQIGLSNPSNRELKPLTIGVVVAVVLVVIIGTYLAFRPDTSESTSLQATDTPATQPTSETVSTSIPLVANATEETTPVATEVPPTPTEILSTPTEEPTLESTIVLAVEGLTPTIPYLDGQLLELHYDPNSFYLYNPSADRINVRNISFEALDNGGRPLPYGMAGNRWADVYNFVDGRACYAIEPFGVEGPYLNPGFCLKENARETPTKDDNSVFWTERSGAVEFRVLWDNKEIARCRLGTNSCEVYVPRP
jgi:hypothetical protein